MRLSGTARDNVCQFLWPCFSLDACECGFADTAGCVELLDADKPDGVGEDGCEGVGVRAEEDSVVRCCKRE